MSAFLLSWGIAAICLLTVAAAQTAAFRWFPPTDRFRFLRRALGSGLIASAVIAWLAFPSLGATEWPREIVVLAALVALGFLFLLTLSFYTAVDGSLRTRMLILLDRSLGGKGTRSQVMEAYGLTTLAERRIEKMRIGGMLEPRGHGHVLTPKGRAMSAVFAGVKRFLRLGIGG
ncbi:MAG TPA: hypothetical protein VM598_12355 [Bdellovibrionota bacterium]|nr:hypothetical protein [Bdellovibrionota bacterium]